MHRNTTDEMTLPVPGRRYEQIDGMLIVRAAPGVEHQRAVARLMRELTRTCPRGLEVLPGPIAFRPGTGRSFAPDLVVIKRTRATHDGCPTVPPLLIAEIIDESSQTLDRDLKPLVYAASGVEHYWTLDPAVPVFTAYRLHGGDRYTEVVRAEAPNGSDSSRRFSSRSVPPASRAGSA